MAITLLNGFKKGEREMKKADLKTGMSETNNGDLYVVLR